MWKKKDTQKNNRFEIVLGESIETFGDEYKILLLSL